MKAEEVRYFGHLELARTYLHLKLKNKERMSWLALRLARDEYLHHFGRIGNGDVIALAQEIEKEKQRVAKGESPDGPAVGAGEQTGETRDPSILQSESRPEMPQSMSSTAEEPGKSTEPNYGKGSLENSESKPMAVDP